MAKIRVQMPEINEPRRKKNARVIEVKTQEAADELIAQGGKILEDEPEPEAPTKKAAK